MMGSIRINNQDQYSRVRIDEKSKVPEKHKPIVNYSNTLWYIVKNKTLIKVAFNLCILYQQTNFGLVNHPKDFFK